MNTNGGTQSQPTLTQQRLFKRPSNVVPQVRGELNKGSPTGGSASDLHANINVIYSERAEIVNIGSAKKTNGL